MRSTSKSIRTRIATLIGGTIIGSLVYTSTALAAFPPLIMEVQPTPLDNPTQLVVYGQYFGVDPVFTFGPGGVIPAAANQDACSATPPAPLDDSILGYSCVVLDIPAEFLDLLPGDYLLEIWATSINEACILKPSELVLLYDPNACLWQNGQEFDCGPPGSLPGEGISMNAIGHNNATWVLTPAGPYDAGDLITLTAGPGPGPIPKWPNELVLEMTGGTGDDPCAAFGMFLEQAHFAEEVARVQIGEDDLVTVLVFDDYADRTVDDIVQRLRFVPGVNDGAARGVLFDMAMMQKVVQRRILPGYHFCDRVNGHSFFICSSNL